jgi:hypothetical protein
LRVGLRSATVARAVESDGLATAIDKRLKSKYF